MTRLFRDMTLETRDDDARTVEASLSSETPYFRPDLGNEILMHSPEAVDLSRCPLPLLRSHDRSELPLGIVENVRLSGGKLRGRLRFGRSAAARDAWEDVRAGVLRSVSIGYQIDRGHQNEDSYVVSRWMPVEVSLVACPADATVGVGRNLEFGETHMENTIDHGEDQGQRPSRSQRRALLRAEEDHREAAAEVYCLAEQLGISNAKVRHFTETHGHDLDAFRGYAMKMLSRSVDGGLRPSEEPEIGLTKREAERYSFVRMIRSQVDADFARREGGFEMECSRAAAKLRGRDPMGLYVPAEVLSGRRDLNVGAPSEGGYLRPVDHMGEGFVDLLRARAMVFALGAQQLSGLRGDLSVPKKTAAASATWVDEGSAPPQSDPAFGQLVLAPSTLASFTVFSRRLLVQSAPDVEMLVRRDLADSIAGELDRTAIAGSGTGAEPTGILNTAGIGSVALGANGGALDWGALLDLEQSLAIANADAGNLAYLTNTKVRRALKDTLVVPGDAGAGFVWQPGREPGAGLVNGYGAWASGNVPDGLTKGTATGVCSAVIFANWADLMIGLWGQLDIVVDQFTLAPSGQYRVVALMDADIGLRRVQSFAAIKDVVTG